MNEDLLFGKPEIKFVIWSDETELATIIFAPEEFSTFTPSFSPVEIEHILQDEDIAQLLKGYRASFSIYFQFVDGSSLTHLIKLFTSLNAGSNYYDRIQLFPSYKDLPGWSIDVCIKSDDIVTAYFNLMAHQDITISFKSKYLLDHIPLSEDIFLTWGNMNFDFIDLNMDYSTLN